MDPVHGWLPALAITIPIIVGLFFVFRAIPWSEPGPWRPIWLMAVVGALMFITAEAAALFDPQANVLSLGHQLPLLALSLAMTAGFFLLYNAGTRLAEQAREDESRRRAVLAALPEPVLVTTPDGHLTSANPAAEAFFGERARAGARIDELLPFVGPPVRSSTSSTWRGRTRDQDGRSVDLEVRLSVVLHGGTRAAGVYTVHDESHLAEIGRLREQMLYSVAHELRQPLTVLDNALDILAKEYESLSTREFDELIASSRKTARRLRTLMDELLSAGSIQSGHFVLQLRPTRLASIIAAAQENAAPATDGRRQDLRIEVDPADLHVLADPRYAQQVVSNLIVNASKYGPEGQPIEVRGEQVGEVARVTVSDRGPGIPAAQQAGLFERFYRVRGESAEPGIGLGLAIAKGIVEAHGGGIGVVSDAGAGTSVWFTLRIPEGEYAAA
ncbi:MAG: ATP-binding protein [Candidatus Limnocylindria bacterium]